MQEFAKRPMTIKEFENIKSQEGVICELIDGIVMMSRPNIEHQKILTNLSGELYQYLKDKKCKSFSEIEVRLNNDILVPDISIICDFSKFTEQKYEGAPDIVVEILSPSTMFNDFNIKSGKYMNAGVKEYWLIDPKSKTVIVNDYVNKTMISYEKSESLKSNIVSDLEIDLNDIFM